MDDHLIGYLLNSLDPDAQRQVEEYLHTHPEAKGKLERLRLALAPLAEVEAPAPPPTLFVNTLARIAEYQCQPPPPVPKPKPHEPGPSGWRLPRRIDVLVAAALLLVVAGLATMWIMRVRQQEQIANCKGNMRLWWFALEQYSSLPQNRGSFPKVESEGPRGVAGVFVPLLRDAKVLSPDASVGCPAMALQAPPALSMKDLESRYQNDPLSFNQTAPTLAGDYAYTLGYNEKGVQKGLERNAGDLLPLLADGPPHSLRGASPNHGGYGQNVLYIGGNVRWCTERTVGVGFDDIYVNTSGQLQTGQSRNDTVLAPSEATPFARKCTWTVD